MADHADSTTLARWNSAQNILHTLNQKLNLAQGQLRDKLERAVAEQEELVLELPAPHLLAVSQKLRLLFDVDVDKPDHDGLVKRRLVDDLGALIGATATFTA
jgi:hypothetical protein